MADLSGLDMIREIIGQINNWQKIVRIGGEIYKLDVKDKKYKNSKGKTYTRPQLVDYIKDQKYKAPDVPNKEKPNNKLKVKTTTKTNPLKIGMDKLNTFTQNQNYNRGRNTINPKRTDGKIRFGFDPSAVGKDGLTRGSRQTINNMMPGRQGGGIATIIAGSLLGEGGLDPGGHLGNWIGNRLLPGPDRTLQENNALRAQLLAEKEINKQNKQLMIKATQGIENPQQTGGVIGRRNEQYIDRPTPTPTTKKEEPKEQVKVNKKKKSTVGKVMGDYAGAYVETESKKKDKKKDDPLKIHGKNPSSIQKKLLKAGITKEQIETLVTNYNKKYRNKRGW